MRVLIATLVLLALTACEDAANPGPVPTPRFRGEGVQMSINVQDEDMTRPDRAKKLRDAGFHAERFGIWVRSLPPEQRRQFISLLDAPGPVFMQAQKGSRDEALLKAARLRPEERVQR